jgi:hypothetical protein
MGMAYNRIDKLLELDRTGIEIAII